jgi:signal transduction histidine kinase
MAYASADNAKVRSGSVNSRRALLRSLSRSTAALVLVVVGCLTAAVGVFVVRDVRTANTEVQNMYAGSVLGLRRIAEMQYEAQETRRSTLYAITTNDSNLQLVYADRSREADQRVTQGIAEYVEHAKTLREVEVGRRLRQDWSTYLKIRDEVLASILEGSLKEAIALDLKGGVPSFDRVRADLDDIKRLYDEQASQERAIVGASSRRSIRRLIAVLCLTLLFATAAVLVIQRSRMQAALQLAKLQMDFVTSVSHELRTPLSVICSAAENIADGVIEGPDELTRYASMIRKQSHQLTDLVNEILLFGSSKERKSRSILRPVVVADVIKLAVENTAELLREERFTLEQRIEAGLPEIMGDVAGLSRCLQNLVVNAVKYSGKSRWIAIGAFAKDGDRGTTEVCISVEDRGMGIAKEELSRIFEPFYRSPGVSAAQIHGTGLGLPIARSIVEGMGGKLSVVSELNRGSTFTLHLQVAVKHRSQVAAADYAKESTS